MPLIAKIGIMKSN